MREKPQKKLTNHVFPHVSHGIEFLLTNFTGKLLFCISMDDLNVFMKGPEFLEGFVTGNTLSRINRNNLYLQGLAESHSCRLADGTGVPESRGTRRESEQTPVLRGAQMPTPTSVCSTSQEASFRDALGVRKHWQKVKQKGMESSANMRDLTAFIKLVQYQWRRTKFLKINGLPRAAASYTQVTKQFTGVYQGIQTNFK